MKSILTKKVLFLALVAVTVFTTGCIKEDLDECYKLTLKIVNHPSITKVMIARLGALFRKPSSLSTITTRSCLIRAISTMPLSEAKKPLS